MKNKPDILIDYSEILPQELIIDELNFISQSDLTIEVNTRKIVAYAALEWTIPTVIVIYVLKPYFDSFLKEAGKEHYKALSGKLKGFLKKGKTIDTQLITSSKSTDKINNTYNQSHTISIQIETRTGKQIKLLFDNSLTVNEWENALDELLEYIIENYENPQGNKSEKLPVDFENTTKKYYAVINSKTKKIEFFDDKELLKNNYKKI